MTTKTEALSGPLRARLSKADRPEREQALLRLALAGMIVAYVAWYTPQHASSFGNAFLWASVYFAAAVAIFLTIWVWPGSSILRRISGIVVDVSMTTWGLWVTGEAGVGIVGLCLFIILGNGFRYGRRYLHITQALSIVGFVLVMAQAPWWNEHLVVGLGLLQILLIVPLYVGILAQRLTSALLNAQRALEECRRHPGGAHQSTEANEA